VWLVFLVWFVGGFFWGGAFNFGLSLEDFFYVLLS